MSKLTDRLLACTNRHEDVKWVLGSKEPAAREVWNRINELWPVFSRLADANFVVEFARHPNNHYWEMFLGYHFVKKTAGTVNAPKPGPDVTVAFPKPSLLLIEAVCPSPGERGRSATLSPLGEREAEWWPGEKLALRFTQAISEKRSKLQQWKSNGHVQNGAAYLIAINSAHVGRMARHEDALSAVYPFSAGSTKIRFGPDQQIADEVREYSPAIAFGSKQVPRMVFAMDHLAM